MAEHTILKGLDLPINGGPEQRVASGAKVSRVAIVGHDYPSMKPRMAVKEGDKVKRGQLLFDDRKSEGVSFTAPAAGTVVEINRGEKRAFQSVVIEVDEKGDGSDQVEFTTVGGEDELEWKCPRCHPDGEVSGRPHLGAHVRSTCLQDWSDPKASP